MGAVLSSIQGQLLLGLALAGLYLGYRAISPKPLPCMPYNRDAANKAFGDLPEVMRYAVRKKQIFVSPADESTFTPRIPADLVS